jgi:hypothetical protein
MVLKELIETLDKAAENDPDRVVPLGFGNPHSYRGFYEDLAFEPVRNTTVRQMRDWAHEALGSTYAGWKGGEFTMGQYTNVWLAEQGRCGETIGPCLLAFMLGLPLPLGKEKEGEQHAD